MLLNHISSTKNSKFEKTMKTFGSSYIKLTQLQSSLKNASVNSFSGHNSKSHSVGWNPLSGSTDKTVAIFAFENKERLVKSHDFFSAIPILQSDFLYIFLHVFFDTVEGKHVQGP